MSEESEFGSTAIEAEDGRFCIMASEVIWW